MSGQNLRTQSQVLHYYSTCQDKIGGPSPWFSTITVHARIKFEDPVPGSPLLQYMPGRNLMTQSQVLHYYSTCQDEIKSRKLIELYRSDKVHSDFWNECVEIIPKNKFIQNNNYNSRILEFTIKWVSNWGVWASKPEARIIGVTRLAEKENGK